jgi:hypothetical protein
VQPYLIVPKIKIKLLISCFISFHFISYFIRFDSILISFILKGNSYKKVKELRSEHNFAHLEEDGYTTSLKIADCQKNTEHMTSTLHTGSYEIFSKIKIEKITS